MLATNKQVFFIALIALLAACGNDATITNTTPDSPSTITSGADDAVYDNDLQTRFYMRYLQSDNRLKATVNFSKKDENKAFKPMQLAGGIQLEGQDMRFKNLKGIELRYESFLDGTLKPAYQFQFKGLNNQQQIYEIIMPSIVNFSIEGNTIKRTEGMTLVLNDEPLNADESLLLFFSDNLNRVKTVNIKGPSTKEIKIAAANLEKIETGRGQLHLVRKRISEVNKKGFSGLATAEFYSNSIAITVE